MSASTDPHAPAVFPADFRGEVLRPGDETVTRGHEPCTRAVPPAKVLG
ncbi:hypothetical protein OG585_44605 [Streptomyces sp. NBC_01340]|nr:MULTISPECIES: hypothetical protein [unclassified Streptomyces]MCX4459816.1 hypothetical protein [Streptomyces sp. NBC_01719]MCX4499174.1 hypothetical protein [Streptomyces sp. NBC_01728]MCX4594910.1 hypothetical protein [Streptomyces sp. NBC_01549]WSI43586.1 hypothetical protein OG585_44605 [Streptomyces sp. NBC_01340]